MKSFVTWFLTTIGFQSSLNWEMECRMQCNAIETWRSFSSTCIHKNRCINKIWFGNLRTLFKNLVTKKPFPTPGLLLKNNWNGLGCHSLFFSDNLQCTAYCIIKLNRCCWASSNFEHNSETCLLGINKLCVTADATGASYTASLFSKSRSSKSRLITENSAGSSSSSDSITLKFWNYL